MGPTIQANITVRARLDRLACPRVRERSGSFLLKPVWTAQASISGCTPGMPGPASRGLRPANTDQGRGAASVYVTTAEPATEVAWANFP